jgi:tetratricopeptide (TPR) repeat protein
METRKFCRALIIVLFSAFVPMAFTAAQNAERTLDDVVREGIEFHDQGRYDEAIERYLTGFAYDSTSSMLHYQIAYAWFMKREFEEVAKYGRLAMDFAVDEAEYLYAVNLYGAALDNLGDIRQAVDLYEEAAERFPDTYLIRFNKGVSLMNLGEGAGAAEAFNEAIVRNPGHASSHLYLGLINFADGSRVKSLYPLLHFLLIEPDTQRSFEVLAYLNALLGINREDEDEPENRNRQIFIPESSVDDGFAGIEFIMSLTDAIGRIPDGDDRPLLNRGLANILSITYELKQSKEEEKEGLYWEYYIPLFGDIANSPWFDLFCDYITMTEASEGQLDRLFARSDELDTFFEWIADWGVDKKPESGIFESIE